MIRETPYYWLAIEWSYSVKFIWWLCSSKSTQFTIKNKLDWNESRLFWFFPAHFTHLRFPIYDLFIYWKSVICFSFLPIEAERPTLGLWIIIADLILFESQHFVSHRVYIAVILSVYFIINWRSCISCCSRSMPIISSDEKNCFDFASFDHFVERIVRNRSWFVALIWFRRENFLGMKNTICEIYLNPNGRCYEVYHCGQIFSGNVVLTFYEKQKVNGLSCCGLTLSK